MSSETEIVYSCNIIDDYLIDLSTLFFVFLCRSGLDGNGQSNEAMHVDLTSDEEKEEDDASQEDERGSGPPLPKEFFEFVSSKKSEGCKGTTTLYRCKICDPPVILRNTSAKDSVGNLKKHVVSLIFENFLCLLLIYFLHNLFDRLNVSMNSPGEDFKHSRNSEKVRTS